MNTCVETVIKQEGKMKKVLVTLIAAAVVSFGFAGVSFAGSSQTIAVNAAVPTVSGGLSLGLSKIDSKGTEITTDDVWTIVPITNGIAFGTLTKDSTYKIFRGQYYYALDLGVEDNSGTVWTITHTISSVKKDATNNLDDNINVSFVKQVDETTSTDLLKTSFKNSNSKAYTKTALSGGWLRIYYGIASGKGDNTGVTAIGLDKTAGTYAGSVTITLTP